MGNNPSKFKNCPHCPVESVSWEDVQGFIQKLNAKTSMQFRLPSEAEWEYAARGGQKTKSFKYSGDSRNVGLVAWWYGNSGNKTHPVGERKANELGLYDMSGNVWEWCADTWQGNYLGAPADASSWNTGDKSMRVLRGGSWSGKEKYARTSNRIRNYTTSKNNIIGFRLVHPVD